MNISHLSDLVYNRSAPLSSRVQPDSTQSTGKSEDSVADWQCWDAWEGQEAGEGREVQAGRQEGGGRHQT